MSTQKAGSDFLDLHRNQ